MIALNSYLPGLYVHIPFCKTKCPYCDFYSITDDSLVSSYLTALDAEARLYREHFPAFDTLFLGGGTPSWLGGRAPCGAYEKPAVVLPVCPGQ